MPSRGGVGGSEPQWITTSCRWALAKADHQGDPGSVQTTADNTVTTYDEDLTGPLTWKLGVAQGPDRFVPENQVFEVVFAV